LVGCPTSLGKRSNTTELITLPISTEAMVHTEIWTNDAKSSEAYVTLKPCCQLDGCLQNVHFVDPSVTTATEVLSKAPKLEASAPSCLLLHHHHHHHHQQQQHRHHSSERQGDAYALVTESTNSAPSISILNPITGNRIFVPPFSANAEFLHPLLVNINSKASPSWS
uniref:C2H2-type domain-containing protein n=1 Tax=Hydatigena taeniaeformis TaxID=6205 RepID=A0A0R3X7M2_HYDTA